MRKEEKVGKVRGMYRLVVLERGEFIAEGNVPALLGSAEGL